jgi:hypothetical protein
MEPLVVAAFPVFCLFWDPCWVAAAVVVVMVEMAETIQMAMEALVDRLVLMS